MKQLLLIVIVSLLLTSCGQVFNPGDPLKKTSSGDLPATSYPRTRIWIDSSQGIELHITRTVTEDSVFYLATIEEDDTFEYWREAKVDPADNADMATEAQARATRAYHDLSKTFPIPDNIRKALREYRQRLYPHLEVDNEDDNI